MVCGSVCLTHACCRWVQPSTLLWTSALARAGAARSEVLGRPVARLLDRAGEQLKVRAQAWALLWLAAQCMCVCAGGGGGGAMRMSSCTPS